MISWADAVKKAHRVETAANLQVRSGASTVIVAENLPLTDWSVSVDGTRAVRRTGSATLADPTAAYVPLSATSLIAPYGVELKLRQRLTTRANATEWKSLATLTIEKPETEDRGWLSASISGSDFGAKVSEARLSTAITIAAGTNVADAIRALIEARTPGLTYSFTTTTATTPLVVLNEQDDPWQRAIEIAGAAGLELFFDPDRVCTLRVPPDPSAPGFTPAFTYEDGPDSILTQVSTSLDTEGSYSHAVYIGQSTDGTAPVRADVFDDDPASPTYYLGPFGDKPVFLITPIVSPDPALAATQAIQAATALLNKKKGAFRRATFESVPVATLEPSDLVRVVREESGLNELLVVDSFSLSSSLGGSMPVTTRAVRI